MNEHKARTFSARGSTAKVHLTQAPGTEPVFELAGFDAHTPHGRSLSIGAAKTRSLILAAAIAVAEEWARG